MLRTGKALTFQAVAVLEMRKDTGVVIKEKTIVQWWAVKIASHWLQSEWEIKKHLCHCFSLLLSRNLMILDLLIIKWPQMSPSALAFYNPMIKSYYSDLMESIFHAISLSALLYFALPFYSINNMVNPFCK